MTGGNIEGNTATGNGGGICEARGSVVDISGGTVKIISLAMVQEFL